MNTIKERVKNDFQYKQQVSIFLYLGKAAETAITGDAQAANRVTQIIFSKREKECRG